MPAETTTMTSFHPKLFNLRYFSADLRRQYASPTGSGKSGERLVVVRRPALLECDELASIFTHSRLPLPSEKQQSEEQDRPLRAPTDTRCRLRRPTQTGSALTMTSSSAKRKPANVEPDWKKQLAMLNYLRLQDGGRKSISGFGSARAGALRRDIRLPGTTLTPCNTPEPAVPRGDISEYDVTDFHDGHRKSPTATTAAILSSHEPRRSTLSDQRRRLATGNTFLMTSSAEPYRSRWPALIGSVSVSGLATKSAEMTYMYKPEMERREQDERWREAFRCRDVENGQVGAENSEDIRKNDCDINDTVCDDNIHNDKRLIVHVPY